MRRRTAVIAILILLGGCREGDGPADPSVVDARIYLTSSPNGAEVTVDGRATGLITPDTVPLRRGDRAVELRLDSAGFRYDYGVILQVQRSDSVIQVELPVGLQCPSLNGSCMQAARRQRDAGGFRFMASGTGSLFHAGGGTGGLLWPATTTDNYAAAGMPVFAALAGGVQVALGMYDQTMLVGRPAPRATTTNGAYLLEQESWILPPPSTLVRPTTVRGILIEEEVRAHDSVDGVLVVRLTFRNVSDDVMVHRFAPHIPLAAVTYTNAYIGYALDPDIGGAGDDWMSYDLAESMVFAYDADFSESFSANASAPGLVGMKVLAAPAGTTVMLNAWSPGGDWNAGTITEPAGYDILTGANSYQPDHPHQRIGHLPPDPRDVRMSVTAGPLTLAPGDAAEITLAIAVASPTGTFSSGQTVQSGEPLDTSRQLYGVAAGLRSKMAAAATLPGS